MRYRPGMKEAAGEQFLNRAVSVEGEPGAELVVLCEHAGNQVPPWLDVPKHERAWLETHWGYDLGAAGVARTVADELGACAVLAEFSRLVCDPNRPLGSESWLRRTVEDGEPLSFNAEVPEDQLNRRRELWAHYHRTVERVLETSLARGTRPFLFSVHSMTHLYVGHARDMELAVLYSAYEERAESLAQRLEAHGFTVARNEPYSGFDGLVYSVERHGRAHDLPYLEIEVRQDLLDGSGHQAAIGRIVAKCLAATLAPEA